MAGSPPTITDVAVRAGVSRQTVSRVINGRTWVASQTKARVLDAINGLGYRRNALASGLRSGRSHTIGMMVSNILNPFFAAEVRGVQDVAAAAGYQVIVGNTDEDIEAERRFARMLFEKQVDGVIAIPCHVESRSGLAELTGRGVPVVLVSRSLPGFDTVTFDFTEETNQAIGHLVERGAKRVALLTSPPSSPTVRERVRAYKRIFARYGLSGDQMIIYAAGFRVEDGLEAMRTRLRDPRRPDAVFATSSYLTVGALLAARDEAIRVPDDLAIVGCNEGFWSRVVDPPLTMIDTDPTALGRAAGGLLLRRITGDRSDMPLAVRLHSVLRVRRSSARHPLPAVGTRSPAPTG